MRGSLMLDQVHNNAIRTEPGDALQSSCPGNSLNYHRAVNVYSINSADLTTRPKFKIRRLSCLQ